MPSEVVCTQEVGCVEHHVLALAPPNGCADRPHRQAAGRLWTFDPQAEAAGRRQRLLADCGPLTHRQRLLADCGPLTHAGRLWTFDLLLADCGPLIQALPSVRAPSPQVAWGTHVGVLLAAAAMRWLSDKEDEAADR